jgi:hypothetical protein
MQWNMQIGCRRVKVEVQINGCTNAYAVKWLLRQHLDNKHGLRMELSKSGRPSTHVGGPRQQNHHAMNFEQLAHKAKVE